MRFAYSLCRWLYVVIAAVALVLLILIIFGIVFARRRKKTGSNTLSDEVVFTRDQEEYLDRVRW